MVNVIKAPEPIAIPVAGSDDSFPVHRVFCVGRNYAEHAIEMGHDPDREAPFFFEKHTSALLFAPAPDGAEFPYPQKTSDVHHEIELVGAEMTSRSKTLSITCGAMRSASTSPAGTFKASPKRPVGHGKSASLSITQALSA